MRSLLFILTHLMLVSCQSVVAQTKDQLETFVRVNYALTEKLKAEDILLIEVKKVKSLNGLFFVDIDDYEIHERYTHKSKKKAITLHSSIPLNQKILLFNVGSRRFKIKRWQPYSKDLVS